MAKASGLSVSTVQRIWRVFGLQPHRTEAFKLSTIQTSWPKCATSWAYTSGHRSTVSFYAWMRSPNPGAGPQPPCCRWVPASRPEAKHDYRRHGTTSLFAALDIATGRAIGEC